MTAIIAALVFSSCGSGEIPSAGPPVRPRASSSLKVYVLDAPGHKGFVTAARIAASEVGLIEGKPIEVVQGPIDGPFLAALTDRPDVLGAITVGGRDAIAAAREALDDSSFPVFEMRDDLYETASLSSSVFQAEVPHSWTAWRLARYFGPDDRGYSSVALMREPSAASEVFSALLRERLAERNVKMTDVSGDTASVIAKLAPVKPQAVVISGSPDYLRSAAGMLSKDPYAYRGKAMMTSGWRPQIAFYEDARVPLPGALYVADYAPCADNSTPLESTIDFIRKAEKQKLSCGLNEVDAYDAVKLLASAASQDRPAVINSLEKVDRKRFGHLPVSLGPDDHVFAERDHLGLWVDDANRYKPIMRTFTSDLERTDLIEEDWPAFFPGADPRGEAPFFYVSRYGIVSDKSDDAH